MPEKAYVAFGNGAAKLGQIVDVSKGGLAFLYIDIGGKPKRSFSLEIRLENNGPKLENLPFKALWDLEILDELKSTKMRKCGGQFGRLTSSQESQLLNFIQSHTVGEA
jgi:hypothetical protein